MYLIRDQSTVEKVVALIQAGLSDYEVARQTGVSRSTVQNWRRFGVPQVPRRDGLLRPLDKKAYAYLLGLYLGDGWVGRMGRSWVLQISLDVAYPNIVREAASATARVASAHVRALLRANKSTVILQSSGGHWPNLFPQHGPGKKHERRIELVEGQLLITHQYPREFIRGLIHTMAHAASTASR